MEEGGDHIHPAAVDVRGAVFSTHLQHSHWVFTTLLLVGYEIRFKKKDRFLPD